MVLISKPRPLLFTRHYHSVIDISFERRLRPQQAEVAFKPPLAFWAVKSGQILSCLPGCIFGQIADALPAPAVFIKLVGGQQPLSPPMEWLTQTVIRLLAT